MSYVEIKHCTKSVKKRTILDDINLSLEKGNVYGFVGHNGSGKTVLFKIIAGIIYADSGEVLIDGKIVNAATAYPVTRGVMIENVGLWPYLGAKENLEILAGINGKIGEKEIDEVLKRVQLDTGRKSFSKFSLGMKQRLILAQAIMEKPELLILDEPTNALDKDGIALFENIVKSEVSRGATVLIASHSMENLNELCDSIIHLADGKITEVRGERQ